MSAGLPSRICALVPADDADVMDPLGLVATALAVRGEARIPVQALVLGRAPAASLGRDALALGADEVLVLSHAGLAVPVQAEQLLAAFLEVLSPTAQGDGNLLALLPAGAIGEELAARLAARLRGAALGRCTQLALSPEGVVAHRAAFAGRAQVDLVSEGGPLFAAMRGRKGAAREPAGNGAVRALALSCELPGADASYVEAGAKMARLEGAKLVVSGGRGIGGPEGFELLERIAAALGGVVGGSLPTVDAGWVPVARQVGQSGKFVTPEVYVAIGISGTPQHLAGIGPDTRIVAVNSDAEANIFKVADVGVVADWKDVVPALAEALAAGGATGSA